MKVKSSYTAEIYELVEDMDCDKMALGVNISDLTRYKILKEWLYYYENSGSFRERFKGNIEECRKEKESYEVELNIPDVVPSDVVNFIDTHYKKLFSINNLSNVIVNRKARRVIYIDEYHFMFEKENRVYHICQFAEICKLNEIIVETIK